MKNLKTIVNETEKYEKMKEDIRMMKSSDELNKEEGKKIKTTEIWVKIVGIHKIKRIMFLTSIKCLKSVLKQMLKAVFTT